MSYEDKLFADIDFNISKKEALFENKPLLNKLLEKRRIFLENNRPNEKNFTDIYPEKEIEGDLQEIARLKKKWAEKEEKEEDFEKYLKNISSIYEILLAEQAEVNNWLGDNCETFATSEHDNIKNGIDIGIIFRTETKKHLGFSTDVTFSSDKEILHKKLGSIKKCIELGSLPSLKYFEDPDTGEHKRIFLPKVIVGSHLDSAEKLIKLWGSNDKYKNKKLSEHSVQSEIILESMYQLNYFSNYAKELSNKFSEDEEKSGKYLQIAKSYADVYSIFNDIYKEKEKLINSHIGEISKDIVYNTIREYTGH